MDKASCPILHFSCAKSMFLQCPRRVHVISLSYLGITGNQYPRRVHVIDLLYLGITGNRPISGSLVGTYKDPFGFECSRSCMRELSYIWILGLERMRIQSWI